ncbi:hypothetical protein K502DRAFT_353776 [Neoconidiobolus thromboides FSU 785]|nr:hypothetical protein K502DRAFT_353776 [Neoconidiobolus thromboides FSU 785]
MKLWVLLPFLNFILTFNTRSLLLESINEKRAVASLTPLVEDPKLTKLASAHCLNLQDYSKDIDHNWYGSYECSYSNNNGCKQVVDTISGYKGNTTELIYVKNESGTLESKESDIVTQKKWSGIGVVSINDCNIVWLGDQAVENINTNIDTDQNGNENKVQKNEGSSFGKAANLIGSKIDFGNFGKVTPLSSNTENDTGGSWFDTDFELPKGVDIQLRKGRNTKY